MEIYRVGYQPPYPAAGSDAVHEQRAIREPGAAGQRPIESGAASAGAPEDTVELSGPAQEIARAQQLVAAAPDVREDKIAEIRARIDAGTYAVSPDVLAARLLGTV